MNRTRIEEILISAEAGMNESNNSDELRAYRMIFLRLQDLYKEKTGHYFPRAEFRERMERRVGSEWAVDIDGNGKECV